MTDAEGDVDPASLTAWVRHPAELNTYWDQALPAQPDLAAKRRSNMIRYQVIFDHGAALGGLVAGVSGCAISPAGVSPGARPPGRCGGIW